MKEGDLGRWGWQWRVTAGGFGIFPLGAEKLLWVTEGMVLQSCGYTKKLYTLNE